MPLGVPAVVVSDATSLGVVKQTFTVNKFCGICP